MLRELRIWLLHVCFENSFFWPADKVICFQSRKRRKHEKARREIIKPPIFHYPDNKDNIMTYILPVVFIKVLSFCT